MTYLDYINQFHRVRRHAERRITSNAADLYFHLLAVANNVGWKPSFNESTAMILAALGMTDKTLDNARELLIEAGLLDYTPGKKGTASAYELLTVGQDSTENFRSNGGRNGGEKGGESGGEKGDLHKIKNKTKTKDKKAPASGGAASEQNPDLDSVKPEAEPEPWLAWLLANAPDVQLMKEPLTAAQWANLVEVFGEPMVKEVLQAMHNTTGASGPKSKYKSANLTAQNWCKRRCPDGKAPSPAPKKSAAPAGPALSAEAVARNSEKDAAELARRAEEFQARQLQPAA